MPLADPLTVDFETPGLDPVTATMHATHLVDKLREGNTLLARFPDDSEDRSKLLGRIKQYDDKLTEFVNVKKARGEDALIWEKQAQKRRNAVRVKDLSFKLKNIFDTDEKGFEELLRKNGDFELRSSLQSMLPSDFDHQRDYALDQAYKEFGFTKTQVYSGLAESSMREFLGAGEHEPTDQALLRWTENKTQMFETRDKTAQDFFKMGQQSIFEEKTLGDFWEPIDKIKDPELRKIALTSFSNARQAFGEFGENIDLARKLRDRAVSGDVFSPGDFTPDELVAFDKLSEQELDQLGRSIAALELFEETDRDSTFWREHIELKKRFWKGVFGKSGMFFSGREMERRIERIREMPEDVRLFVPKSVGFEKALTGLVFQTEEHFKGAGDAIRNAFVELDEHGVKAVRRTADVYSGYLRMLRRFEGVRDTVAPLLDDNMFTKATKIAAESVNYMAMSLLPSTAAGVLMPTLAGRREEELELIAPDMDPATRRKLSTSSAIMETALIRLEGAAVLNRLPGVSDAISKVGRNFTTRTLARTSVNLPLELGMEFVEEQSLNTVRFVANAFDESIPDADFAGTSSAMWGQMGEMTLGMFPLVLLGSGISARSSLNTEKMWSDVKQHFTKAQLLMSGRTEEQVNEILALPEGTKRIEKFQEFVKGDSSEEIIARIEDVSEEVKAEAKWELKGVLGVRGESVSVGTESGALSFVFSQEVENVISDPATKKELESLEGAIRTNQLGDTATSDEFLALSAQEEINEWYQKKAKELGVESDLTTDQEMFVAERIAEEFGDRFTADLLRNLRGKDVSQIKERTKESVSITGLPPEGFKVDEDSIVTPETQTRTDVRSAVVEDANEFKLVDESEGKVLSGPGRLPFINKVPGFKWLARKLRARGRLPKTAFEAKIEGGALTTGIIKEADINRRELESLVKAEAKRVKDGLPEAKQQKLHRDVKAVLVGERPLDSLPESLREITTTLRKHVDALSTQLEAAGFVQGDLADIVLSNRGTYLNRSYRRFDDAEKWSKQVSEPVKRVARKELRKQYLQREGESEKAYAARIEGKLNLLLTEGVSSPAAAMASSKMGRTNLSNLKTREDVPKWLRDLWGERQEANEVYLRTVYKMAQQLGNYKFLSDTRSTGLGDYLFEPDPDTGASPNPDFPERISAEGNPSMAPLDGLFTSIEIAKAFNEFGKRDLAPWLKILMTSNAYAKFSKTVLSPITHVRNFNSNLLFLMANGNITSLKDSGISVQALMVDFLPPSVSKHLMGDVKFNATKNYLTHLAREGVIEDAAVSHELEAILKESLVGETTFAEFTENRMRRAVRLTGKAAVKTYAAEDAFWKILNYEAEKKKYRKAKPEMTEEELSTRSAMNTRATMPTYSLIPEGVKDLRRFPFMGNFVSFSSEVIRNNYNMVRLIKREMADSDLRVVGSKRLSWFLTAHALPWAVAAAARNFLGVDDEDEDAVRALAAPWDQDSQLVFLPSEKEGNPKFLNISYTDPFAMFKKIPIALANEDDPLVALGKGFVEMFEPFVAEEIFASSIIDVMRNAEKEGGEVYDPFAPANVQAAQMGAHVWKALEPNIIPQVKRVVDSWDGERDFKTEVVGIMTGQRVVTLDPEESLLWDSRKFASDKTKAAQQFTRVVRDKGKVSDSDIRKSYLGMVKARNRVWEDFQDSLSAAQQLGTTSGNAIQIARNGNAGKRDTIAAIKGETPKYRLSDSMMKTARGIDGRMGQLRKVVPELFSQEGGQKKDGNP